MLVNRFIYRSLMRRPILRRLFSVDISDENEILRTRIEKIKKIKLQGIDPYPKSILKPSTQSQMVRDKYESILKNSEEDPSKEVKICGRIMLQRFFGKLSFFVIQDSGQIQLYIDKSVLGVVEYDKLISVVDSGDIIGVTGFVKKTNKGELSIVVKEWKLLTKSLRMLPEKYHGLSDVEKRFRHRHTDMIVNPTAKKTLILRSAVISSMRRKLESKGFMEVETPVLQYHAGGADATPFKTFHNAYGMNLFLRIATELHLKRMLVGGFDRVFEVGRIFRNEGVSTRHNPEFTSLELYMAYADCADIMELTEWLLSSLAEESVGLLLSCDQAEINMKPPFARLTMTDCVRNMTGLNFTELIKEYSLNPSEKCLATARQMARSIGIDANDAVSVGNVLVLCFEERCEKALIQPTFITDFPVEVSPLARKKENTDGLCERFELYINQKEIANAFTELTDPIDQRERFIRQAKLAGNEDGMDEEFLNALEIGMPPAGGLGIGIDRFIMMLVGAKSIREVIAFPFMKPDLI